MIKKSSRDKIRIFEVAKAAGVSPTTVSRVINKISTVKDRNRKRVTAAIKRLNYKPDISAQRLARGGSEAIGLIIPRFEDVFHSYYVSEIIKGLGMALERQRQNLLIHITDGKSLINPTAVGGVLFSDIDGNIQQVRILKKEKIPFVVMNNFIKTMSVNCVGIDNKKGAIDAVDYLISLGHRRIATITGKLTTQAGRLRLEGYRTALKEAGIRVDSGYICRADYSPDSASKATKMLLNLKNPPTAIFIASDRMAQATLEIIKSYNLVIPDDISIVGFDDQVLARHTDPPLTTVSQPLQKMAHLAVELLNQVIQKKSKEPKKVCLPTRLVIRKSCKSV